jgi:phenylacetate-CoA ligase
MLTADDVDRICDEAERRRDEVAAYPADRLYRLLAAVRARWLDPDYGPRREAERALPDATGFSPAMVALGMDAVCWTLDPANLKRKVDTEFRGIPRQADYAHVERTGTLLRWHPLGIVLHVLAGNVFVGAAGSLVEGLLTGNVNVLKVSSQEKVFLPKLLEAFHDCDADRVIAPSLAIVDYSSSQSDVLAAFKRRADGIVVWGGEEAVRGYRNDLPARTRLVVFGPKLSVAVVTAGGFCEAGVESIADELAGEISIWDQNACTAPQACYVEGEHAARALAGALATALERVNARLPAGRVDLNAAVEIRKLRTVAEIAEARGEGLLREAPRALDWTVIVERDPALEPSPLSRTLRIIPVSDLTVPLAQLRALRGYVQSVGLVAAADERLDLIDRIAGAGAVRIVELGKMAGGEVDDPHDGAYDLPQLMHLVMARVALPGEATAPVDVMPEPERRALIDARLRALIDHARRAPLYERRLEGVTIDGADDLPKLPMLTREDMDRGMPPKGEGLATGPYTGGYVSRSGGSTGEPKFSVYDGHDWEHMIDKAVRLFRALGVRAGDRLANFMLAGDLYGSFVSFDHINARLGVTSFGFASAMDPAVFLKVWREFRVNVVEGVPSTLVPFLRKVKAAEPAFTIEKVVYAGSPMSAADRAWIADALAARRIGSVVGANDGGAIAYQCEKLAGALHHVLDDFNLIEIVDDEGAPLPDGQPGRILITSLLKYAFPLIRYEIGDVGRILPGGCTCGRTSRVIEYLGRADDILCVAMMNVSWRDITAALAAFPISQMQLAAGGGASGETLTVRVEIEGAQPGAAQAMRDALLAHVGKLAERLADGGLAGLTIEVLPPGALPRNPRTGKVRAVVDER